MDSRLYFSVNKNQVFLKSLIIKQYIEAIILKHGAD